MLYISTSSCIYFTLSDKQKCGKSSFIQRLHIRRVHVIITCRHAQLHTNCIIKRNYKFGYVLRCMYKYAILATMYVCMYVCMYVSMYLCMYVCTSYHVCVYVCIYVCIYVLATMYVCMYVSMYVCTSYHVCVYVSTTL